MCRRGICCVVGFLLCFIVLLTRFYLVFRVCSTVHSGRIVLICNCNSRRLARATDNVSWACPVRISGSFRTFGSTDLCSIIWSFILLGFSLLHSITKRKNNRFNLPFYFLRQVLQSLLHTSSSRLRSPWQGTFPVQFFESADTCFKPNQQFLPIHAWNSQSKHS